MSQGKGYVTLVSEKPFGAKKLYSFRVSTEEKWFRTGEYKPNISKNDYISFFYVEKNGNYNVDVGSIEHVAREESSSNSGSGSGAGVVSPAPVGRDEYWAAKEKRDISREAEYQANSQRIQYQSARNAAISVVDILVREKILKLSDAAKADNVAVVLGKIDDLTDKYFEASSRVGGVDSNDRDSGGSGAGGAGVGLGQDKDIPWE